MKNVASTPYFLMNKKIIFISDLHLDERYPQITTRFLDFLNRLDASVEAVYILGDFFNVWVGDDDISPFSKKIWSALRKVAQQRPLYFLPGNRDFLLGERFAKETGCTLLKDPTVIDIYGAPMLLMHGDSLCTKDIKHLRFRKIAQHPITKFLFLKLPLSFRKKIAQELRQQSRRHLMCQPGVFYKAGESEVRRVMQQFGVKQMIHGHTHEHKTYSVDLNGQQGQRLVLGDWEVSGSILICEPDSKHTGSLNTLVRF